MREKQKKLYSYLQLVGKYAFFVAKFILAILMLISLKTSPKKRNRPFALVNDKIEKILSAQAERTY